jgi:hypothetical protein
MKIHGVRIYPKSVSRVKGHGAPIFVHGSVDERITDFYYIFGPLAPLWRKHTVAHAIGITLDPAGKKIEDPEPELRKAFKRRFVAAHTGCIHSLV